MTTLLNTSSLTPPTGGATSRAFLVRRIVTQWTGRKMDKAAGEETQKTTGANEKAAVKVYKSLIACDELEQLKKLASKISDTHRKRTVPWHYEGPGAITATGFADYVAEFKELEAEFNTLRDKFCDRYADARAAAVINLGTLFNENDYPTVDVVRSKFTVTLFAEPIPESSDFRVQGLSDATVNKIKAEMQNRMDTALKAAQADAWDRVVKRVEHLMTSCKNYKPADESASGKVEGKFYDTTVSNIQELVNLLPSLNVTNDPALTDIATRLQRDLCQIDGKTLREEGDKRETVGKAAEAILTEIWAKRRAQRGQGAAA